MISGRGGRWRIPLSILRFNSNVGVCMDFRLSDEHLIVQETVRSFARRELASVAEKMDREDYFPEKLFRGLGKIGMLGVTVPQEFGGSGLDYLSQAICLEELARVSPAFALSVGAHSNLCLDNLCRNGSEYLRENYVGKLCTGELIGCLGLTEPGSGSDALSLSTRAVRHGSEFLINGSKTFITNAPVADIALVYARTGNDSGRRISAFCIPSDSEGFSRGKKFDKMGMRGSPTGELIFRDCRVNGEQLLGKENAGTSIIMSGLNIERAVLAAISLGIQEEVLDIAGAYAVKRRQFGVPISRFELIQEKIATMYVSMEASRLLIYRALEQLSREPARNRDAAAAILFAAENSTRSALDALQIMGGYGYMRDFAVEKFVRDAKLLEIGAGTSEIRKIIIAREVLEGYGASRIHTDPRKEVND